MFIRIPATPPDTPEQAASKYQLPVNTCNHQPVRKTVPIRRRVRRPTCLNGQLYPQSNSFFGNKTQPRPVDIGWNRREDALCPWSAGQRRRGGVGGAHGDERHGAPEGPSPAPLSAPQRARPSAATKQMNKHQQSSNDSSPNNRSNERSSPSHSNSPSQATTPSSESEATRGPPLRRPRPPRLILPESDDDLNEDQAGPSVTEAQPPRSQPASTRSQSATELSQSNRGDRNASRNGQ